MLNDEWMTPPDFIKLVREVFGGVIDLDPATNEIAQRYINANEYYSISEGKDGLSLPWGNRKVFCNPPYSRKLIQMFAAKAVSEVVKNSPELIMLVNSSTDTEWYQSLARHASITLLWKTRVRFWKIFDGAAHSEWLLSDGFGNSPRYLNTVFYFGDNAEKFVQVFKPYGVCMRRVD